MSKGHRFKRVYKLKKNTNGKIIKYKVRIIGKGYVQEQGRDFEENFALITRLEPLDYCCLLLPKMVGKYIT